MYNYLQFPVYFSHYFGIEYINNMLVDTLIFMIHFNEKWENFLIIVFASHYFCIEYFNSMSFDIISFFLALLNNTK